MCLLPGWTETRDVWWSAVVVAAADPDVVDDGAHDHDAAEGDQHPHHRVNSHEGGHQEPLGLLQQVGVRVYVRSLVHPRQGEYVLQHIKTILRYNRRFSFLVSRLMRLE